MSGRDVRREEAPAASALGSAAGIGVRRMTSWVELVVFPGAKSPRRKRFGPRRLSLDTRPLIYSSVRGWLSPWTFNRNVLVLTISPEWVSKLPGMLGPL